MGQLNWWGQITQRHSTAEGSVPAQHLLCNNLGKFYNLWASISSSMKWGNSNNLLIRLKSAENTVWLLVHVIFASLLNFCSVYCFPYLIYYNLTSQIFLPSFYKWKMKTWRSSLAIILQLRKWHSGFKSRSEWFQSPPVGLTKPCDSFQESRNTKRATNFFH